MAKIQIATTGGLTLNDPCGALGCTRWHAEEWGNLLHSLSGPLRTAKVALQPTDFPAPPSEGVGLGGKLEMGMWYKQYHAQWDAFLKTKRGQLYDQIRAWLPKAEFRSELTQKDIWTGTGDAVDEMATLADDGAGLLKQAMDMGVDVEIPQSLKESLERAQEEEDEWSLIDKAFGLGALAIVGYLFVQYKKET